MKRKIKWLLWTLVLLTFLGVGGWQFENWRGNRAWQSALARAEAEGVELDFSVPEKPNLPDNENLLKNEVFLKEYLGEVEPILRNWDRMELVENDQKRRSRRKDRPRIYDNPAKGKFVDFRGMFEDEPDSMIAEKRIDELTEDIQGRTDAIAELILNYPIHDLDDYEKFDPEGDAKGTTRLKLGSFANLCWSLETQAILSLRLNRPEKALRNFKAIGRLAQGVQRPGSINALISHSLRGANKSIIWEGIRLHAWSDAQLAELVLVVNSEDPIAVMEESLLLDLLYNLHTMKYASSYYPPSLFVGEDDDDDSFGEESDPGFALKVRHSIGTKGPRGWTSQRKAILLNSYADLMAYRDEWHNYPDDGDKWDDWPGDPRIFNPFFVAKYANIPTYHTVSSGLKSESSRRIALIALAAEKHYQDQGSYPASLAEMKLGFDTTDVTDPKQRPISYKLDKNGYPEIWSLHESQNAKRPRLRWQFWEDETPP